MCSTKESSLSETVSLALAGDLIGGETWDSDDTGGVVGGACVLAIDILFDGRLLNTNWADKLNSGSVCIDISLDVRLHHIRQLFGSIMNLLRNSIWKLYRGEVDIFSLYILFWTGDWPFWGPAVVALPLRREERRCIVYI